MSTGNVHRRRIATLVTFPIIAVVIAVALGACGSSGVPTGSSTGPTTTASTSTFELAGTVSAGPTCPVARPGSSCPDAPVHGAVIVRSGTEIVARATTDPTGTYRVQVPAGTYVVDVDTGAMLPRCPRQQVTVTDRDIRLDVSCDTGVR